MTGDLAVILAAAQALIASSFAVFLRVGAAMAVLPGFGEQVIPARVRLGLALAFTAVVAPAVPQASVTPLMIITEPVIGLAFGMGLRLMVMALQIAGTIAAQSTSLAQMFAGAGVEPQPIVAQMLMLAGIALAMTMGLHLRVAEALIETYRLFPAGSLIPAGDLLRWGIERITDSFSLAFGLAMPFVIAALIYNVALGIINRAMPQLMVAFVGAPALTAGGLILLALATPLILEVWSEALSRALSRGF